MVPIISGILFCGWVGLVYLLFRSGRGGRRQIGHMGLPHWKIARKEFIMFCFITAICTLGLSLTLENPLLPGAGFITGIFLPPYLLARKRYQNRLHMLTNLTDPLHLLVSRLPDQQNLTKTIEITRDEVSDPNIHRLLDGYVKDVGICGSTQEALYSLGKEVGWRKFDIFLENLVLAHHEGFTGQAISALSKSVQAMEEDLQAIEKVRMQSAARKKKLYFSLGIAWLFPLILSLSNTGHNNVYLHTWPGKVLIFFYAVCTPLIFVKGEEYLSLKLEEI